MSRSPLATKIKGTAMALLWCSAACSPAPPPAPTTAPTPNDPLPTAPAPILPTPSEPRRPGEIAAPATSSDRGCEVAVRTRVVSLGQGRYELIASAANETDHSLQAELLFDCPGTPARFEGLPAGYDLGNLCQAGACVGGSSIRQPLELPPGGSSEIARVTLDTAAGPCNAELPAGSYSIGASVRLLGAQSCSTSRGTFEHAARTVHPPPPRSPAPGQPSPAPARAPAPAPEPCPPMACRYTPCPPGVKPPEGCARVCGCPGHEQHPTLLIAPQRAP